MEHDVTVEQPQQADGKTPQLLPLDSPERVITFKHRGWPYTYSFRRITHEDWQRFFNGIVLTSQNQGKVETTVFDFTTAGAALVEATLLRVEGYAGAFEERQEWRALLPIGHVKAAAELLRKVQVSEQEAEVPIDPLSIEVAVDAAWGTADGAMGFYRGLLHRFGPPTVEHRRKYNRAVNELRVIGGSRTGKTVYVPRQKVLLGFYDELVTGVEGYSVAGEPLRDLVSVRREMDAFHKVVAVQQLFETPDEPEGEPKEEEEPEAE